MEDIEEGMLCEGMVSVHVVKDVHGPDAMCDDRKEIGALQKNTL